MYNLKVGGNVIPNEITSFTENIINASEIINRELSSKSAENLPYVSINMNATGMKIPYMYELFSVDENRRTTVPVALIDTDTEEVVADLSDYDYIQSIMHQITPENNTVVMVLYRFTDFNK